MLLPDCRLPGRGPVVLRLGTVLMLPWLIVLALLAIALCPTTPLSAVVAGFSAVGVAAYLPVPADCAVPTLPGLSGDTAHIGRDGLPKTWTGATMPRWWEAAGIGILQGVCRIHAGASVA